MENSKYSKGYWAGRIFLWPYKKWHKEFWNRKFTWKRCGFGQVYKGTFNINREDTILAVKRVTNQVVANSLLDELMMLARLRHANVVRLYLHEYCDSCISHMDLKPSNILLDQDMRPKIADFGLSRAFANMKTHTSPSRGSCCRWFSAFPPRFFPLPLLLLSSKLYCSDTTMYFR
ncbi:hypothetical protein C2845_PM01G32980 [Panicum miliaceum]|uniref:Protein kinase domain-containing protein n=1 Tax=Panicum miliaceum TaxID=4540 RepID=A0A3L6TMR3_PANMI|nr:hypothetical protein C2845_PM01G32980 [Panicum miliaceum]